jgi:hypothetical protein
VPPGVAIFTFVPSQIRLPFPRLLFYSDHMQWSRSGLTQPLDICLILSVVLNIGVFCNLFIRYLVRTDCRVIMKCTNAEHSNFEDLGRSFRVNLMRNSTFCFIHGYGVNKKKTLLYYRNKKNSSSIYIFLYVLGRFY